MSKVQGKRFKDTSVESGKNGKSIIGEMFDKLMVPEYEPFEAEGKRIENFISSLEEEIDVFYNSSKELSSKSKESVERIIVGIGLLEKKLDNLKELIKSSK